LRAFELSGGTTAESPATDVPFRYLRDPTLDATEHVLPTRCNHSPIQEAVVQDRGAGVLSSAKGACPAAWRWRDVRQRQAFERPSYPRWVHNKQARGEHQAIGASLRCARRRRWSVVTGSPGLKLRMDDGKITPLKVDSP